MFRIAQRDPKQQKLVKIRLEFFENVLKTKIVANSRIVVQWIWVRERFLHSRNLEVSWFL